MDPWEAMIDGGKKISDLTKQDFQKLVQLARNQNIDLLLEVRDETGKFMGHFEPKQVEINGIPLNEYSPENNHD